MIKKLNNKQLALLISLLLILTVSAGGTLAYIATQTGAITNTFKPTEVTCNINETMNFNNTVKSDVSVTNTGGTDAYIRVAIIATWQKTVDNKEVVSATPVQTGDYTVDWTENTKWVKYGDYWYYTVPVAPNGTTEKLFDTCSQNVVGPDGCTLHVELIADAIQSSPADAVKQAWGFDPSTLQ